MTGLEFESFLVKLLIRLGYINVKTTPPTDQGGDILATSPDGRTVVVQAKRWNKPVGNKVVQEILGALLHYSRDRGVVITNSRFTAPACKLARKDKRITLHDGAWLESQIKAAFPEKVPQFTWAAYHELIEKHPEALSEGRTLRSQTYRRRKQRRRY